MTEQRHEEPQQIAVWYFIGATFIFAAPTIFLQDSNAWTRILILVLGLGVLVAGFLQLRREVRAKRQRREAGDADAPDRPGDGRGDTLG